MDQRHFVVRRKSVVGGGSKPVFVVFYARSAIYNMALYLLPPMSRRGLLQTDVEEELVREVRET